MHLAIAIAGLQADDGGIQSGSRDDVRGAGGEHDLPTTRLVAAAPLDVLSSLYCRAGYRWASGSSTASTGRRMTFTSSRRSTEVSRSRLASARAV